MLATTTEAPAPPAEFIPNGCDIDGYTTRFIIHHKEEHVTWWTPSSTICIGVNSNPPQYSDPDGNSVCKVSTNIHRCCGHDSSYTNAVECFEVSENHCTLLDNEGYHDHVRWCPLPTEEPAPVTPAPPAEDSGLSAGAIAGIAVGAVLAVVAAGVVLL